MVALLLKHAQRAQSVAAPPWQCPSSAPAVMPPKGAPGGSGQLGTPRARPRHWGPASASGARASRLQSRRFRCVWLRRHGADANAVDAGGNTGAKLAEKTACCHIQP
jgi:hypothetical protein